MGDYLFWGCTSLTSIICRAVTPPTIGSGGIGCAYAHTIRVPAASVNDYKAAAGWSDYASIIIAIP
jgi:hypothetical protein